MKQPRNANIPREVNKSPMVLSEVMDKLLVAAAAELSTVSFAVTPLFISVCLACICSVYSVRSIAGNEEKYRTSRILLLRSGAARAEAVVSS